MTNQNKISIILDTLDELQEKRLSLTADRVRILAEVTV